MKTSTLELIEKAAEKGTLNKSTWNGCVFNAAGDECGIQVNSMKSAKAVDRLAFTFIARWDSLRGYTTEQLLVDVRSVLATRTRKEPFYKVDMGRVKGVRRRRIADSTMFTMEDFENSLKELVDA